MNILMLSPGYPVEMRQFTRGLTDVGARVIGVGDTPEHSLSHELRGHLAMYFEARSLWDEVEMVELAQRIASQVSIDRVECLWEPGMILAAQLRQALGLSGMTVEQTIPFRDKEIMKRVLDRAGIRTPRHARARTADEVRKAAAVIGYPLILKPIAGAGATDTYPVGDQPGLEAAIARLGHVSELSVEEFVDGDELTFDTICAGGELLYANMSWYRPRPLDGKLNEWISPQAIALRDLDTEQLAVGREMGLAVLDALGFRTGFTHMEWYRKADGEAVFGEIAARPPGARGVDIMNFASDIDLYRGWAEAVCHGTFSQPSRRKYNAAIVFKRARGRGRIQRIEGLEELIRSFGDHICAIELQPIGHPRRDWKQLQISDGFLIVRHPDLDATLEMADRVGTDLTLYAE